MTEVIPSSAEDPIKPTTRGWVHAASAVASIPAVWVLVNAAQPGPLRWGALTFGVSMIFLFATSGAYHTGRWTDATRAILRLIDHCMIFVFLGGTYTPFLLASQGDIYDWFLPLVWVMTLAGIARTLFLPNVKRWIKAGIYVVMGWMAVPLMGMWVSELGAQAVGLLVVGGVSYTIGAVIYTKQRPNTWPETWGYHEYFHVTVVLGAALHYKAVWTVVV